MAENGDYQMLIKGEEAKIIFTGAGTGPLYAGRSAAMIVEVSSHRMKAFINSIIPKQGAYLIEYCLKQTSQNLRASTFKKVTHQSWNVETMVSLRDWLQSEKEFATGITHD